MSFIPFIQGHSLFGRSSPPTSPSPSVSISTTTTPSSASTVYQPNTNAQRVEANATIASPSPQSSSPSLEFVSPLSESTVKPLPLNAWLVKQLEEDMMHRYGLVAREQVIVEEVGPNASSTNSSDKKQIEYGIRKWARRQVREVLDGDCRSVFEKQDELRLQVPLTLVTIVATAAIVTGIGVGWLVKTSWRWG